jgi:enamine deaminase RidA (YjgF/YER057c/UK114 family)
MNASFEENLNKAGLQLPPAPKPVGLYQPVVVSGKLAFLSGQVSKDADGKILAGKVGKELSLGEGQKAARFAALNALSIMKHLIGFEKISRVVKMTGFVQTAPDFYEIPAVVNGASELLLEVMGEQGAHGRSAVGMASLPLNAAVEIELILELK